MFTFLSGFFIGCAHVLSGPDHLAAVIPFSLNLRKKAWLVGLSWGIGHTAGAIGIGVLFILFKEVLPFDAISAHSETLIGIMLILIGVWSFYKLINGSWALPHRHPHFHLSPEPHVHTHEHSHESSDTHHHIHSTVRTQTLFATTGIGTLHGLAGFSHLLAVLPSLVLPGKADAVVYLTAFGLGTVITMILFTEILGRLTHRLEVRRQHKVLRVLAISGACLSILIGILWIVCPF